MRRSGTWFLVLIFAVSFVAVMGMGSRAHSEDVIKLKYATFMPPAMASGLLQDAWCKEVEKRTNGKVKFSYHPGGTLTPANQAYEAAVRGIADVSVMTQQYNAGRFPLTEALYLPLGIRTATQATKLILAWYDKFKPKEYDDVKMMFLFCGGPGQFVTLKPNAASINDLKGVKIRAAGDSAKIVAAMGAVPVSIPLADSYEGLQRGVIAGSALPTESLKSWKFGDLFKSMQINDGVGYASALGVVMNKKKWESLPPDIQKTIEQVNKEWAIKTGEAWTAMDKAGVDYGMSKGMKVYEISAAEEEATKEKMKPILDAYVANMKKLGLPGEESLKFCLDFVKANK
jgi:TRAP-type C4-dicarboxylate transport system substrate-binding protein